MKWIFNKFLFILFIIISHSIISIYTKATNKFLTRKTQLKEINTLDEVFLKIIGYNEIIQKVTDENFINDILNNKAEFKLELDQSNIEKLQKEKIPFSNEDNKLKEELTNIINEDNRDSKGVVDHTLNYIFNKKEVNIPFNRHKEIINAVYENILKNKDYLQNPSSFLELANKINPDADPPKPYTSDEIMCKSSVDCMLKKLKYQKCSVARVNIRTIYEVLNVIFHIMAKIIFLLCACVAVPSPSSITIQCMNTASIPGLVCTIPNMVFKGVYKISVMLYKIYQLLSNFCWNPLGP